MMNVRAMLAVLLLAAGVPGLRAQSTTSPAPAKATRVKPRTEQREILEQMNQRIERLEQLVLGIQRQMAERDQQVQAARQAADTAHAEARAVAKHGQEEAESAQQAAAKDHEVLAGLQSEIVAVKTDSKALAASVQTVQKETRALETPGLIRFMGIELRPGGYLAGETVSRQRAIGGDINTQFTGIPFAGQTAADFSEFNGSGRQSRFSLLVQGKLSHSTLRGYYEADFLSAGVTSNDNQSNSYTLRQRQVWAQAEMYNGWAFTGGQMWSLATETRAGITNNSEATPLTIDAAYNVGFTWERQYGFRVVKKVGNKLWVAGSLEEPQTLNIGGHNLPALVYQQAGNSGGAYNSTANYSYNYAPDLIAKVAYEPGFGHYELFAIGRFFRARVFPDLVSLNGGAASTTPTAGAFTTKTQGGGVGVNAHIPVFTRRLEFGAHILAGDGLGRYSASTLPDATEHPNGSLELLSGGSALGSLEWHALPRLDLYGYYGGEYVKRAYYASGLTVTGGVNIGQAILTGYGAPTNNVSGCYTEASPVSSANGGGYVPTTNSACVADNRNLQEGTLGYWYRFYRGPKGTLQMGMQYSYEVRHTWLGVGDPLTGLGGSPKAIDNMWFTSFRYYLPQAPQ